MLPLFQNRKSNFRGMAELDRMKRHQANSLNRTGKVKTDDKIIQNPIPV